MPGKQARKSRIAKWYRRRNFMIKMVAACCLLPILIFGAMVDFVSVVRTKDNQVQSAALQSQLAQFVLGLREEDGFPLLENPAEYPSAQRNLSSVSLKRSFFSYLLNRSNAASFEAGKLAWEMPKACAVDFQVDDLASEGDAKRPQFIRTCLAEVPSEVGGRYLYLAIRYPSKAVTRHMQGMRFSSADHINVELKGDRSVRMELVFEPATLAEDRYPSQKHRFIGLHEVTAYDSNDANRPLRFFNGQAYEHQVLDETDAAQPYVTILARIDAALVSSSRSAVREIATSINPITAEIAFYKYDAAKGFSIKQFEITYRARGTALISIEKLYKSQIISNALVEIKRPVDKAIKNLRTIWSSTQLVQRTDSARPGIIQNISDRWANLFFEDKKNIETFTQKISGSSDFTITLAKDRVAIPDIATRSFLFLSMSLGILFLIAVVIAKGMTDLYRIFGIAYKLTVSPGSPKALAPYRKRRDEIGTLGWIFSLLVRRGRSRNALVLKRMEREEQVARLERAHVKSRKATLDSIGHEIRSPLQTLLSKVPEGDELRRSLNRMSRAIDILDLATSVEDAFENVNKFTSPSDIAEFLSTLSMNSSTEADPVIYRGPSSGVVALFDPINFETVLDHILENAERFKYSGSQVSISLVSFEDTVQIEIFNVGPKIEYDQLETIFDLGISSEAGKKNLGQGLYVARVYIEAMNGLIHAENRDRGVAFVINLASLQSHRNRHIAIGDRPR